MRTATKHLRCSPLRHRAFVMLLAALCASAAVAAPARELPAAGPAEALRGADLLHADPLYSGADLQPGEFRWLPGALIDTGAPVMIVVSLDDQRAYVYRDGLRIGVSTVSTGKPGHETPTGVYEILQKQRLHHSNLYEDPRSGRAAAMPWMQRLSWEGVALHAGRVRAAPASHGCVRLPEDFARQLYRKTKRGGIVVIARDGSLASLSRAGAEAPLAALVGASSALHELAGAVGMADRAGVPSAQSGAKAAPNSAFAP